MGSVGKSIGAPELHRHQAAKGRDHLTWQPDKGMGRVAGARRDSAERTPESCGGRDGQQQSVTAFGSGHQMPSGGRPR